MAQNPHNAVALMEHLMQHGATVQLDTASPPIRLVRKGELVQFPSEKVRADQDGLVYCVNDGNHLGCEISLGVFIHKAGALTPQALVRACGWVESAPVTDKRTPQSLAAEAGLGNARTVGDLDDIRRNARLGRESIPGFE